MKMGKKEGKHPVFKTSNVYKTALSKGLEVRRPETSVRDRKMASEEEMEAWINKIKEDPDKSEDLARFLEVEVEPGIYAYRVFYSDTVTKNGNPVNTVVPTRTNPVKYFVNMNWRAAPNSDFPLRLGIFFPVDPELEPGKDYLFFGSKVIMKESENPKNPDRPYVNYKVRNGFGIIEITDE